MSINPLSNARILLGMIILALFALLNTVTSPVAAQTQPTLSPQQLKADLKAWHDFLKTNHCGIHRFSTEEEIDAAFSQAEKKCSKSMNLLDFYWIVCDTTHAIQCGHTPPQLPSSMKRQIISAKDMHIPVAVIVENDELFVSRVTSNVGDLAAGNKIISINDHSASEILETFRGRLAADGSSSTGPDSKISAQFPIYYSIMIDPTERPFRVAYVSGEGKKRELTVPGVSLPNAPTARRRRMLDFSIKDNVATFAIGSFNDDRLGDAGIEFADFIDNSIVELNQSNAKGLVVDLRGNTGGDDEFGASFVAHLLDQPFHYFERIETTPDYKGFGEPKWDEESSTMLITGHPSLGENKPTENAYSGPMVVLIDGATFSTAADVAWALKRTGRATFVGHETGGTRSGNNSGVFKSFTLPASKINASVPLWSYFNPGPYQGAPDRGVIPDHVVKLTPETIASGRDVEMELARKIILEDDSSTGQSHDSITPDDGTKQDFKFSYVDPDSVGVSSSELESLSKMVSDWVDRGRMVGAECLIIKDRKIVFHEAFGWNNREEKSSLKRNGIFRMRSMTKPLVGTSILQLAENGKLNLDDSVAKYLSSWDNGRSQNITIRQLMLHIGGFNQSAWPQPFGSYPSLRDAVDAVGQAGPQRPPGDDYRYSDLGSSTLGALIAEVSGMSAEKYIEENILDVLGMKDSHTFFSPDVDWANKMNATYIWNPSEANYDRYWDPSQEQQMPFFRACGGLYSTTLDYARLMQCWMDGGSSGDTRLLSNASVQSALTAGPFGEYGMQWFVAPSESGKLPSRFGHSGSDGTYGSAFPSQKAIVLFFTQSRSRAFGRTFTRRAADLLGLTGSTSSATLVAKYESTSLTRMDHKSRAAYVGQYRFDSNGARLRSIVREDGENLLIELLGEDYHLIPTSNHEFKLGWIRDGRTTEVYRVRSRKIRFDCVDGRAEGFQLMEQGRVLFNAKVSKSE